MAETREYPGHDLVDAAIADSRLRSLVDRMMVLWNGAPLEMADEVYASDLSLNGAPVGVHGLKALLNGLRSAFPDMGCSVDDVITDGERIVLRMTWTGTHKGDYALRSGAVIPASGRSFSTPMIEIYELRGGDQVSAAWLAYDALSHVLQLGAELAAPAR